MEKSEIISKRENLTLTVTHNSYITHTATKLRLTSSATIKVIKINVTQKTKRWK